MGRWEAPADLPGEPLAEFAAGLRALREQAGSPPYEVLAQRAQCSASTLSIAASGRVMPSLSLTLTYVRACGGDPRAWGARWHALNAALSPGSDTPAWGVPAPEPADQSRPTVRGPSRGAEVPGGRPGAPLDAPGGRGGGPDDTAAGRSMPPGVSAPDPPVPDPSVPEPPVPAGPAAETAPALTRPPSTLPWDKAVARSDGRVAGPAEPGPSRENDEPVRPPDPGARSGGTPQITAPVPPRRLPDQHPFGGGAGGEDLRRPGGAAPRPHPPAPPYERPAGHARSDAITRPDEPRPGRSRPVPPDRAASLSTGGAAPAHRAGRSYRRLLTTGGAAVALSGAALTTWLALEHAMTHPRQASQASMPVPHTGRSARVPGAAPAVPGHGGTTATASQGRTAITSPPPPAGAAVMAGPGCAAPDSASGAAQTGQGGDGWIQVGGGPAECAGQALATFTTTSTGTVQDTYTWSFRTGTAARCTLRLFIADTNPSSASAHYDVYGAAGRLGGFTVVQAANKGRWVREGTWNVSSGVLRLRLTDQADYPGAHHHVTASAASASCR